MDLKIFHDTVRYFLNKEQGGWLSPEEIDNITDRAQMWFFQQLFEVYGKTQKIQDALSPFVTKLAFTTGVNGIVLFPVVPTANPCYEHFLSNYVEYSDGTRTRYKPIKIVSEDELAERLDSSILEPSVTDPVGIEEVHGQVQLYPKAAMSGHSFYLRRPLKPVFVYTQTGRTINYNAGSSVQLEWAESSINKILIKTIQMCGVNLSDEMIIQFTELKNSQDI